MSVTKHADLHIHTYYSDGSSSPQEVVAQAKEKSIECIAITDHDTIDGVVPVMAEAKQTGLEVIAGLELSSEINGKDVHMLGYFVDLENKNFLKQLDGMQSDRIERMKAMIAKLKELGMGDITLEEVTVLSKSRSIGRPHLASILVQKGHVPNLQVAFNKYLAEGAPAYVPHAKITPMQAIELINQAGGVAVLAHPMLTLVDELIPQLVRAGLGGLEVFYPNCSDNVIAFYEKLAKKHQIVATGGSDAHGSIKRQTYLGKVSVPYAVVEELKKRVKR